MTNGTAIAGSVFESTTTYTNKLITNENALSSFASTLRSFPSDTSTYISDNVSPRISEVGAFFLAINYIVDAAAIIMLGMTCFFAYQTCKHNALAIANNENTDRDNSLSNDASQDFNSNSDDDHIRSNNAMMA